MSLSCFIHVWITYPTITIHRNYSTLACNHLIIEKGLSLEPHVSIMVCHGEIAELAMEVLLLPVKSWQSHRENHRENHREHMGNSTVSSPFVVRYGMPCVNAKCFLYFISIHRCQPLNSAKLPCVYHIMVYILYIYYIRCIYIYMLFKNLSVYVSILSCLV